MSVDSISDERGPDTRQDSSGQLGRGDDAKNAHNFKRLRDRPTQQGVESATKKQ